MLRSALLALLVSLSLSACYSTRNRDEPDPVDASVPAMDATTDIDASTATSDAGPFDCADPSLPPPPVVSAEHCWCAYLECSIRVRGSECYPEWLRCEDEAACASQPGDPPPPEDLDETCWCGFLRCHERGEEDCSLETCGSAS